VGDIDNILNSKRIYSPRSPLVWRNWKKGKSCWN